MSDGKPMSYYKSKNKYVVKDGLIKFNVSIDPIRCQCHKNDAKFYCEHIIYVLRHEFKLSDFVIKYFHVLDDQSKILNNNKSLTDLIKTKFRSDNCGFCLCPLMDDFRLCECKFCSKFVHEKCLEQWLKNNKECIYCRR
jgi:hypothetical protein